MGTQAGTQRGTRDEGGAELRESNKNSAAWSRGTGESACPTFGFG